MKLTSTLHRWASEHSRTLALLLPVVIVAVALGLRLYGIDWDQGHLYHPDERAILMRVVDLEFPTAGNLGDLLDAEESPLNPRWFPYGSLPLYLLKSVQSIAGNWTELDVFDLRLPGRVLSAFADTGTVIALLALGTMLYGRRVGLLAAGLLAVTVLHIQISHFFTVDSFIVFFTVVSLIFMVRVARGGRLADSALAGLFVGLALASKASAAALLLPLVIAHLLPLLSSGEERLSLRYLSLTGVRRAVPGLVTDGAVALWVFILVWLFMGHAQELVPRVGLLPGQGLVASLVAGGVFLLLAATHLLYTLSSNGDQGLLRDLFPPPLVGIVLAVAAAVAVLFIAMPYAFLDWATYLGDVGEQWLMSQRALDYPYTRQYENTTPYLYFARQLGVWGLGLPLGLAALGGLLLSGWMALRHGNRGDVLLLSWVVPIFILVGGQDVKFLRYLLPVTPLLVLMGARLLFWLKDTAVSWRYPRPSWVAGLMAVGVGATALYAVAYDRIYSRPHPATEASAWLQTNASPGSVVLKEHWEEGIPDTGAYRIQELPLYDPDTVPKMQRLATSLSQADYLLFYSNRLYGTIPRLPERYPLTTSYYDSLFNGDLGYTLERQFTSYPNLLGIALKDATFSRPELPEPEYDGPESSPLATLNLGFADESFTVYDHPKVLAFKNTERLGQEQLFSLLTAPVEPEPLGLMLTPQELQTQRSGGTFSELFDSDGVTNRFPVVAWILLVELVSLVVLPIGFLLFRGLPDRGYLLSKIMGLLLLAYIPWLLASQGLMNFGVGSIYLGLAALSVPAVAIAVLKRNQILSFLSQRWRILAFEEALFLVAFFAFLALRWANPDLWHPFRGGEKPMDFAYLNAVVQSTTMPPYDPWFAGGFLNYYYFGQFMVGTLIKATGILPEIAYNLAIPLLFALTVAGAFSVVYNLTESLREGRWARRGAAWGPAAAGVAAALLVVVLGNLDGMVQLVQGAGRVLFSGESVPAFDFWRSTRMMPPDPPGHEITEFPYFTFLFADLHAHLIVIPFTLLAAGLALNLVLSAREKGFRWSTVAFPFVALGVAVGSLATINTWDYPSYLLLGIGAVALGYYAYHRGVNARLLVVTVVGGVLLAAISYLAFLPFHQRYIPPSLGVGLSPAQTGLHHYMAIHGLFLFIVASYLVYEGRGHIGQLWGDRGIHRVALLVAALLAVASLAAFILDESLLRPEGGRRLGDLSALIDATTYATVPFLFFLIASLVLLMARRLREADEENPQHLFLLGLIGGALALGIVVDVVTANNDIERMNTVFKLYLQAWVLYGLAGGVVLWYLFAAWGKPWRALSIGKGLWMAALALLVTSAAIYPVLGTRARLADRFSTESQGLDGTGYMETTAYRDRQGLITLRWDAEAIDWLRANVKGSPVIAEGNTPLYRWGSRVSIYTGLPTIIGWDWHQTQQRFDYGDEVRRRIGQVQRLFTTSSQEEALQILREHDASYIYVGQLERLYYPEAGLTKFDQMTNGPLEVVYSNQEVTIYRVNGLESVSHVDDTPDA